MPKVIKNPIFSREVELTARERDTVNRILEFLKKSPRFDDYGQLVIARKFNCYELLPPGVNRHTRAETLAGFEELEKKGLIFKTDTFIESDDVFCATDKFIEQVYERLTPELCYEMAEALSIIDVDFPSQRFGKVKDLLKKHNLELTAEPYAAGTEFFVGNKGDNHALGLVHSKDYDAGSSVDVIFGHLATEPAKLFAQLGDRLSNSRSHEIKSKLGITGCCG